MKQKLFGALALSVALAACTNEEELVIATNGGNAQLAGRPVIGQVDLTTTPATRAAVVDGTWGALTYQTGDAIGAALVDEPVLTPKSGYIKKDGVWYFNTWSYAEYVKGKTKKLYTDPVNETGKKDDTQYVVTNTKNSAADDAANWKSEDYYALCGNGSVDNIIHTNYGYTNNNGSWTTEANLVEGHYMFYFPFNANNSARTPIDVEIPAVQDCSDGNSAIDKFYAESTSPIAVDVKFLKKPAAGQKATVNATPNHLFAFPQFKIVNNFNGYKFDVAYSGAIVDETNSAKVTDKNTHTQTMTIKKVELVYTGVANTLWTKATINASALNTAVKSNWEANKFVTASYTSAVTDNETQPGYNEDNAKRPYLPIANTAANFGGSEQVITCEINKELANGQEYVFNAIMPAEKYAKDKLKARVYVTIGTKDYILMTATTKGYENDTQKDDWSKVNNVRATGVNDVFVFTKAFELVRGERYPIVEYNTDSNGNTSVKSSAGKTLTINLSNLHAFEVGNYRPTTATRGFETAEEFIAHMEKAVRGEVLTEVSINSSTPLTEHQIAFKKNITLDAALVEAIYNNVEYGGMDCHMILNETNLAIANDVAVTQQGGGKYKLTGNGKSIFVQYNNVNTDGTKLVSGINEIASNCTLAKKSGNDGIGIVFLASNATIQGGANTFRIVVNSGTLTVDGECAAKVETKNGSSVSITYRGSMTNSSNYFANYTTITNNSLRTINGNVNGNTITANLTAWPTSVTSQSKVNKVVINPTTPIAITVDQAGFSVFQNANTYVELGTNVTAIRSTADVNLTTIGNLKQIKGSCPWNASTGSIIITAYKYKNGSNPVQINGLTQGTGVTFNEIDRP